MRRSFWLRVCLFVSVWNVVTAFASPMQDLNTVTIPVADHSATALHQALAKGLFQVLTRMGGSEELDIASYPSIKQALSLPEHYVQQYSYQQSQVVPISGESSELMVQVIFNRRSLESLLQQDVTSMVNKVWLVIMEVNNLQTYTQVLDELKNFSLIRDVIVQDMGSKGLLLKVSIAGDSSTLAAALATNSHFIELSQQTPQEVLRYRWIP